MYKVILITSSNTRDRYDAVLDTWGKHVDLYSFSDEEYKGTIKASNNSEYESHIEKTFFALRYMYDEFPETHYLLVDDDTFINYEEVECQIQEHIGVDLMGRLTNGYKKDRMLTYLSGGAGICMSINALHEIYNDLIDENISDKWCDVVLGKIYRKLGITFSGNYSFHSRNPQHYRYDEFEIKNAATFHYVTPEEMKRLYNICY